ncbi:MAG: O-antigen ligase family protein [Candidatus Omnitrophota bacterium]
MKKISKYLDYIIYWSMVAIPFFMAIAPAPMNVFMGLLVVAFLVKKALKKERLFVRTALDIPLLVLFLVTCASVFNSVNLRDSLKGGIGRLAYYIFILFIIIEEVKDKRQLKNIVFSMAAGVILASVDSIWQVVTAHDFIRGYTPVVNLGIVRATASFKDSNTLGVYLSSIAPLIFGLSLYYLRGKKKAVGLFFSLIVFIGIALTYSRPTLLAIYLALFFFGIVRKDKTMIAALIVITLVFPFLVPQSVKKWAKEMEYNPLRIMCNDDRVAVYHHSLNMIKAHPFIGVGAGAYMKSYKYYKESPEYRNIVTLDEMKAHNNFLHMAAEIGLVGFGAFLLLLYKLFDESRNIYKRLKDEYIRVILLSLSACIIAFLINGLTESSLYYSRVAPIFWYLTGLLLSLSKFVHADK